MRRARGRHLRTAYLSATRGEGGQNLIGEELGVGLGLIRSQELMAARRLDGARQFFTRAFEREYLSRYDPAKARYLDASALDPLRFELGDAGATCLGQGRVGIAVSGARHARGPQLGKQLREGLDGEHDQAEQAGHPGNPARQERRRERGLPTAEEQHRDAKEP